jgi:hypothetical protein
MSRIVAHRTRSYPDETIKKAALQGGFLFGIEA